MRSQQATIETSEAARGTDRALRGRAFSRGILLDSEEYLSEAEWDARCARSYWQSLADTPWEVASRKLRFDVRRAVQQLRAVFSSGTR